LSSRRSTGATSVAKSIADAEDVQARLVGARAVVDDVADAAGRRSRADQVGEGENPEFDHPRTAVA
jgi:hypothetical protein